ncbi:MAG: hypothetical protein Q7R34_11135 [Dehalococcoidia bacterium]|nr:hypothetical protein [Dehalococcoidia bacterium]
MVNNYWLAFTSCGCSAASFLDTGTLADFETIREWVKAGWKTGISEQQGIVCALHNEKEKEVNMVNKITECPHKTLRDWPDCYQDCDFNSSYDCPQGGTETIQTSPGNLPGILATTDKEAGAELLQALKKRTRIKKGALKDFTVETLTNAYFDVYFPEWPVGKNKVFIRLWAHGATLPVAVEWHRLNDTEGQGPIEAIAAHLLGEEGQK